MWCMYTGPLWREHVCGNVMRKVRLTLHHAATEAANQGGSLRLLPPPKINPEPFLLRRVVVIDAAGPPLNGRNPVKAGEHACSSDVQMFMIDVSVRQRAAHLPDSTRLGGRLSAVFSACS